MTNVEAVWSEQQQALWQRLEAHDFGTSDCALTFERRLAREHGWSEAQAAGAIREYKRFCFLSVVAGHVVTPSDAVDEVWHQHLTYSRDYWRQFCPVVLGTELHHEPTRGGRDQGRLHYAQYAETLASYQHWFGAPPLDYWPDALNQTASPARWRRIDLARHWTLRKPSIPRLDWRQAGVGAALLAVAPLLQALPLNPLEFDGPTFLMFYITLIVAGGFAVAMIRRNFGPAEPVAGGALDTWATAYLAGGTARVVDAGVASLIAGGKATWNRKRRKLVVESAHTIRDYPLDEIARAAQTNGTLPRIIKSVNPRLDRIRRALLDRRLLLDGGQRWLFGLYCALPFAAITALGVTKTAIGIARGRPVGFLVFLTIILAVATLMLLAYRPERSRAGDKVLAELNQRHAHARRAPRDGDIGLAVALAGTAVLAGTAYADFHQSRDTLSSTTGSGCSSSDSSCSSDSGSSCSSGCGGCGGGGD
jgi:uncharacterized protein (TIGR04222 family)